MEREIEIYGTICNKRRESVGGRRCYWRCQNAALGILAAAIMADEFVTVTNLPDVKDVNILLEAISETGAAVVRDERHTVRLNGKQSEAVL